ncbi:unnamed protein product, partial [marine sediment metagenome]
MHCIKFIIPILSFISVILGVTLLPEHSKLEIYITIIGASIFILSVYSIIIDKFKEKEH